MLQFLSLLEPGVPHRTELGLLLYLTAGILSRRGP